MKVFNLFSSHIACADALAATRRSLSRRDRRIAWLKRRLRETREDAALVIERKSEIIAGLEQALLSHAPVAEMPADERIAELTAQLEAMTALAESLHQREHAARP